MICPLHDNQSVHCVDCLNNQLAIRNKEIASWKNQWLADKERIGKAYWTMPRASYHLSSQWNPEFVLEMKHNAECLALQEKLLTDLFTLISWCKNV